MLQSKDIGEAGFRMMSKLCAPNDFENPEAKIESWDPGCMPPCNTALHLCGEMRHWRSQLVLDLMDMNGE